MPRDTASLRLSVGEPRQNPDTRYCCSRAETTVGEVSVFPDTETAVQEGMSVEEFAAKSRCSVALIHLDYLDEVGYADEDES